MSRPELSVSFLGGASAIGASCALVQVAGTSILIDCGVRFRADNALPDLAQLDGVALAAVLVTHAHSDHTGGLPVVCSAFPDVPVYATPPTIDLIGILLRDSLKLMNLPDRDGDIPLYTKSQVARLMHSLRPVPRGRAFDVGEVSVSYLPASHILGAAMIHLATPAGHVLFTGDYSVSAQRTVAALTRPSLPVDMIVTESTYGNRLHEDRKTAETRLVNQVADVVGAGGRVLIPAFAVGRAQEILLILKQALRRGQLPEIPVFVDGMIRPVCDVYGRHAVYASKALEHEIRRAEHPFYTNGIQPVIKPKDRRDVLSAGPCVIVASSGMLSGGASVMYAEHLATRPEDAIFITGYQDEESPGRALLRLTEKQGPRMLRLNGNEVEVKCRFDKYGLSAHADRMQMVGLIEALRPRTVVLVHGDQAAKRGLARSLSSSDIVLADEGTRLTRTYPRRRMPLAKDKPIGETDREQLAQLLGPPRSKPIQVKQLAEAWLGRPAKRAEVHAFAERLEELELVQRHARNAGMVWVLGSAESRRQADEAAFEEELKRENAKGKLLALCARLRVAKPRLHIEASGSRYMATMTMDYRGERVTSPPQQSDSKKTAERLAARALLHELIQRDQAIDVTWVDEERAALLREQNPKGRLNEGFAACGRTAPSMEHRVVANGFLARSPQTGPGEPMPWFGAPTFKMAEQAACAALLEALEAGASDTGDAAAAAAAVGGHPAHVSDARMKLNELRQTGVLRDFGYALLERKGTHHAPLFVVEAWAQPARGARIGCTSEARSKKAAKQRAADILLDRLIELAIAGKTASRHP